MPDGSAFLGLGTYTVPEAARLSGVSAPRIRRWLFGPDGRPILLPQLPRVNDQDALGFHNLIEVIFVRELVRQGVTWPTIRKAIVRARDVLGEEHPFATQKMHTDGRGVFLEVAHETGDRQLLNLVDGNFAMLDVLERSFTKSIRFDAPGRRASLWYPRPDTARVVIDPTRSFGRPIDEATGVPTEVLATALRAEKGDVDRVARWWKVPREAVEQAAEFEVGIGLRDAA